MKMNCLGDSITFGYQGDGGLQMKRPYPVILKELLELDEVRNYGINGSTIADGENPMYLRYQEMDDKADIVSVLAGTNDYGRTEVEISKLGQFNDKTGDTVYGALHVLCSGLKQKYPNAFLFFMTPLLCDSEPKPNKHGYTLDDVRKAIVKVCDSYHIKVFDLYHEVFYNAHNKEFIHEYGVDGWHPNQKFVEEKLAPAIAQFVKENHF
ncbi:MAG: SGNH/GDSL hydrolase family protein [Firmicutes bacterium]|nr:SGNH/GDSL hydrolase family protein [Bacillota bacterium]